MSIEQRLKELNITLPRVGSPLGNYVHATSAKASNSASLAARSAMPPSSAHQRLLSNIRLIS